MSDSTPGKGGKKARKTSKEAASQERARVKDEKAEARSLKLQLLADTSQSDDHALREACFNGEDEAAARIIRRQPSLVTEVDEDGLLEIKMRFASTSMAKATEMFSHFFLYPLSSEEEELDDDEPVDDLDAGGP